MRLGFHRDNHILPHRLWAYLHVDGELTDAERDHALECPQCRAVLKLCLKSDTFAAVLLALAGDSEDA